MLRLKFKSALRKLGVTQREFAEQIGVMQTTVSRYSRNEYNNIGLYMIEELCHRGLAIEDVIEYTPKERLAIEREIDELERKIEKLKEYIKQ